MMPTGRRGVFAPAPFPTYRKINTHRGASGMEQTLYEQARLTIAEITEKARLKEGSILVIGCSTSEIIGARIGTNSAPKVAAEVFGAFYAYAKEKGIYLAVQCCEHLNRAIVIEREAVALPLSCGVIREVNVVPQPKAGGSFATAAYSHAKDPVVLEHIAADCGIDIGGTLIGMHLKEVAVPLRLSVKTIGSAPVTAARTRAKFIGGSRAVYDEGKL
jgi:uncharacterized protein (TIGR01440 family)